MTKETTISIPCKGGKFRDVTGKVAWFQIGNEKIKFFIQNCGLKGVQLTHFASGMTVANDGVLNSIKISSIHGIVSSVYTDREACRQALEKIEKKVGLSAMITKLASAEIINK
jgi:hypothetical protein